MGLLNSFTADFFGAAEGAADCDAPGAAGAATLAASEVAGAADCDELAFLLDFVFFIVKRRPAW
jgi:hypothetical protein